MAETHVHIHLSNEANLEAHLVMMEAFYERGMILINAEQLAEMLERHGSDLGVSGENWHELADAIVTDWIRIQREPDAAAQQ